MSNPKTTTESYNKDQTLLPLSIQEETTISQKRNSTPAFIPYDNQQTSVIFDIQDLIPTHHVARVIDQMIESIEDRVFFEYYQGGGRSSYHPKMMAKVILYAYSQKVYSCRAIAKLIEENIPMMWLAAFQKPDYRTINRFRTQQMEKLLPKLFEEMIHQLIEEKHITMENYFLDGTKIVWKKTTTKFEAKLQEKIEETYQQIQTITNEEGHELSAQDETSSLTAEENLTQIEKY